MPGYHRRRQSNGLDAWPGYVDALSTLLMVTIFVLLVFVLAQGLLSVTLTSKDKALAKLNQEIAQLTDMLSLEQGHTADLRSNVASLAHDLNAVTAARDTLAQQLSAAEATANSDSTKLSALTATRDKLRAELADSGVQATSASARLADLQSALTQATAATAAAQVQLQQNQADLARQKAATAAGSTALDQQKDLTASAQAEIELLRQQMAQLRDQLAAISAALQLQVSQGRDKDAQIADLGRKLNLALAAKVQELQRYRSDFFGKLRDVLKNQPDIRIVGDRFVFQSDVLFPVNSADMTGGGQGQIDKIASAIRGIAKEIPPGLSWMLRVDGHADSQPITSGPYKDNWQLSAARAISVVQLLILDGVPPNHLAATAFADTQPIDTGTTPDAFARNRRIEFRLTDR
jgi:chemotaxis protein MotB